jgi:hypothetical protein
MAQRTIYECDRCHTEWEADQPGEFPPLEFPPQWSVAQSLGVTRFILCETCTAALKRFLRDAPAAERATRVQPPAPPLLDEADHTSDETAP